MNSKYDVYLCRGLHNLVGTSVIDLFTECDYVKFAKGNEHCWLFYYDDETKIITRVERFINQGSFMLQKQNESCLVGGWAFRSWQHINSISTLKDAVSTIASADMLKVEDSYELIKLPEIKKSKPESLLYSFGAFFVSFLVVMVFFWLVFYLAVQLKSPT